MPSLQPFNWHDIAAEPSGNSAEVAPSRRLLLGGLAFAALLAVVFGRLVWLECRQGEAFRRIAAKPIERRHSIPGIRGRILARDGSVLAVDEQLASLAVRYRWFEEPADPQWLRSQGRKRLPREERRIAARLEEAEQQVLAERDQLHRRLAELCQLSLKEWRERTSRIQARVEAISSRVNERRQSKAASKARQHQNEENRRTPDPESATWTERWLASLSEQLWPEPEPALPPRIVVAEELDEHVIVSELPLEVVAEIEAHSQAYPGVKIVSRWRRHYPSGAFASHIIGHLGPPAATAPSNAGQRVGRMGVEQQYEQQLRGLAGEEVEVVHRDGQLVARRRVREPTVGRDLVLTLDLGLQRAAETLLDNACRRRDALSASDSVAATGGGIVVLDVHSGAILAAASAPRFDPGLFSAPAVGADTQQVAALLSHPAHPLFDRTTKMALPPGSVFKPLTAIALLENGLDANQPIHCRGYLHRPDAQRCAIFTRRGQGHGDVDLIDALTQSCNVYFFQGAGELGLPPLVDWSQRFGFGRPTGVDLQGEAAGSLPGSPDKRDGGPHDSQSHARHVREAQALAIGQSSLTATPLQVARFMAAIANGGWLVTPHVADGFGLATSLDGSPADLEALPGDLPIAASQPIARLSPQVLETVQAGLEQVVASPQGTAHATVFLEQVAIAGKTGTAQAGAGRADHAWFAGYCPADKPKVAFVVVLEHGGDGGSVAGPVARRLVARMLELGTFNRRLAVKDSATQGR